MHQNKKRQNQAMQGLLSKARIGFSGATVLMLSKNEGMLLKLMEKGFPWIIRKLYNEVDYRLQKIN
jgi:hypothetical protein